jgi:hypothetical protein
MLLFFFSPFEIMTEESSLEKFNKNLLFPLIFFSRIMNLPFIHFNLLYLFGKEIQACIIKCVCLSLLVISELTDTYNETQYELYTKAEHSTFGLHNPLTSITPTLQPTELLRWEQN